MLLLCLSGLVLCFSVYFPLRSLGLDSFDSFACSFSCLTPSSLGLKQLKIYCGAQFTYHVALMPSSSEKSMEELKSCFKFSCDNPRCASVAPERYDCSQTVFMCHHLEIHGLMAHILGLQNPVMHDSVSTYSIGV